MNKLNFTILYESSIYLQLNKGTSIVFVSVDTDVSVLCSRDGFSPYSPGI